jgi:hypothetical protein
MKLKVVLAASAILVWVGSLAHAQTVSNGPYYATPSWDQQLPASTRFIVLSNWIDASFPSGGAAVLDRETGLVWERSPDTTRHPWASAQSHCNTSGVGNRKGWRLPTLQELASLVDPTATSPGPTLPAGHPFTAQGDIYWSATSDIPGIFAWFVNFLNGSVTSAEKIGNEFVWCVRGGHGVDPQ